MSTDIARAVSGATSASDSDNEPVPTPLTASVSKGVDDSETKREEIIGDGKSVSSKTATSAAKPEEAVGSVPVGDRLPAAAESVAGRGSDKALSGDSHAIGDAMDDEKEKTSADTSEMGPQTLSGKRRGSVELDEEPPDTVATVSASSGRRHTRMRSRGDASSALSKARASLSRVRRMSQSGESHRSRRQQSVDRISAQLSTAGLDLLDLMSDALSDESVVAKLSDSKAADLVQTLVSFRREFKELQTDSDAMTQQLDECYAEMENLIAQLETETQTVNDLDADCEALAKELETANRRVADLQSANAHMRQEAFDKLTDDDYVATLGTGNEALQQQINKFVVMLRSQDSQIKKQMKLGLETESAMQRMEDERIATEAEKRLLSSELLQVKQECAGLQRDNEDLVSMVELCRDDVERVETATLIRMGTRVSEEEHPHGDASLTPSTPPIGGGKSDRRRDTLGVPMSPLPLVPRSTHFRNLSSKQMTEKLKEIAYRRRRASSFRSSFDAGSKGRSYSWMSSAEFGPMTPGVDGSMTPMEDGSHSRVPSFSLAPTITKQLDLTETELEACIEKSIRQGVAAIAEKLAKIESEGVTAATVSGRLKPEMDDSGEEVEGLSEAKLRSMLDAMTQQLDESLTNTLEKCKAESERRTEELTASVCGLRTTAREATHKALATAKQSVASEEMLVALNRSLEAGIGSMQVAFAKEMEGILRVALSEWQPPTAAAEDSEEMGTEVLLKAVAELKEALGGRLEQALEQRMRSALTVEESGEFIVEKLNRFIDDFKLDVVATLQSAAEQLMGERRETAPMPLAVPSSAQCKEATARELGLRKTVDALQSDIRTLESALREAVHSKMSTVNALQNQLEQLRFENRILSAQMRRAEEHCEALKREMESKRLKGKAKEFVDSVYSSWTSLTSTSTQYISP